MSVSVAGASGDGAVLTHADGRRGAVGKIHDTVSRDAVAVRAFIFSLLTRMKKSCLTSVGLADHGKYFNILTFLRVYKCKTGISNFA